MEKDIQTALDAFSESALLAFGDQAQTIKCCEELGELLSVLMRRLNGREVVQTEIIDEVADVLIMASQMRKMVGVEAVDERIRFKMNRTMEFIRNRKEGNA